MAKKLTQMTTDDLMAEMSIAGNPEKVIKMYGDMWRVVQSMLDIKNRAEMINMELALKRMLAEIKLYQKMYDKSHVIKL